MGKFYESVAERLELWVRQLAWLNTAPEKKHKGSGTPPEPVTRLKAMQARDEAPLWPPNPAPHITEWLLDIGPTISGEMGQGEIGWPHLDAWSRMIGIELDPWEARTIRRLSKVFITQAEKAKKPECPPPFLGDRAQIVGRRESVANRIRAIFSGGVKQAG